MKLGNLIKGLGKQWKGIASATAILLLSINTVVAGVGGDAWLPIWTELQGYAIGYPGKILAMLAFLWAVGQFARQNWAAAIGSLFGCVLIATAEGIIAGYLNAGLPI